MIKTAYEIVIGGDLPRIGSGYRLVYASEGRKWVHITDLQGNGRTRITKKKWSGIKRLGTLAQKDIERGFGKARRMLYGR